MGGRGVGVSQELVTSMLDGTAREKRIDVTEERSVTSLHEVSLISTTGHELRDHLDL